MCVHVCEPQRVQDHNHDFEARKMKSVLRIKQGPRSLVTVLDSEVSTMAGFHATSPDSG